MQPPDLISESLHSSESTSFPYSKIRCCKARTARETVSLNVYEQRQETLTRLLAVDLPAAQSHLTSACTCRALAPARRIRLVLALLPDGGRLLLPKGPRALAAAARGQLERACPRPVPCGTATGATVDERRPQPEGAALGQLVLLSAVDRWDLLAGRPRLVRVRLRLTRGHAQEEVVSVTEQPCAARPKAVGQHARHFAPARFARNEPQPAFLDRHAHVVLVSQWQHLAALRTLDTEGREQRAVIMAVQKHPAAAIGRSLGLVQRPGELHTLHADDALTTHCVAQRACPVPTRVSVALAACALETSERALRPRVRVRMCECDQAEEEEPGVRHASESCNEPCVERHAPRAEEQQRRDTQDCGQGCCHLTAQRVARLGQFEKGRADLCAAFFVSSLVEESRRQGQCVAGGEFGEPFRGGLRYPLLRLEVCKDESEPLAVPHLPLEVVHQRPREIAAHVDAVLVDGAAHLGGVVCIEVEPPRVIDRSGGVLVAGRRPSVLSHIERWVVVASCHPRKKLAQTPRRGVEPRGSGARHLARPPLILPEVVYLARRKVCKVRRRRASGRAVTGRVGMVHDKGGAVVIQPEEVRRALERRFLRWREAR
eukprot:scaffold70298_cov75-Phaeocystis_antarctica.AAC.1